MTKPLHRAPLGLWDRFNRWHGGTAYICFRHFTCGARRGLPAAEIAKGAGILLARLGARTNKDKAIAE
jgi:hypothetical protein